MPTAVVTRKVILDGGPGTGKTTELAARITDAARRYGSDLVFVGSLTKATKAELIRRRLPLEDSHVRTLHAHAFHALGKPGLTESKAARKEWNLYIRAAGQDLELSLSGHDPDAEDIDGTISGFKAGDEFLNRYELARARMVPREEWTEGLRWFAGYWEAWKYSIELLDWPDLLDTAITQLPAYPAPVHCWFFDEYQDFSAQERTLADQWGDAPGVMEHVVAGDGDQAIFQWRGASADGMNDPNVAEVIVLPQSYRLPSNIHRWCARQIAQVPDRRPKHFAPVREGGLVQYSHLNYWHHKEIVDLVEQYVDAGTEVGILATWRGILGTKDTGILGELRRRGVPFHHPGAPHRGDWNPIPAPSEKRTRNVDRLLAYFGHNHEGTRAWTYAELDLWIDLLLVKAFRDKGSKKQLELIIKEDVQPDELFMAEELPLWFSDEASEKIVAGSLAWLIPNMLTAKYDTLVYPLNVLKRRRKLADLIDPPRCVVSTIHSAKGMTLPVTIVAPELSTAGYTEYTQHPASVDRLFYVAGSRASEALILLAPATREAYPWIAEE